MGHLHYSKTKSLVTVTLNLCTQREMAKACNELKGVVLYTEHKNNFTMLGVASVSADGQIRIHRCWRCLLNESQLSDSGDPGKMQEAAD